MSTSDLDRYFQFEDFARHFADTFGNFTLAYEAQTDPYLSPWGVWLEGREVGWSGDDAESALQFAYDELSTEALL